ncbi:TonB-dependent receptor [Hyphomonas sp.]|uniref:TonB-dependent receptor n=1 Tax=Hyphomonas sp. TaxID=87 RepID=UPI003F6FFB9E
MTLGQPAVADDETVQAVEDKEDTLRFERLTVTAQKREESILEVPIAITAFGEDDLVERGFSQIEDLAFAIPNVSIQNSADARTTTFTIRGITGQTLFAGASSATGIFVDGVYINNPIAQSFEILDIERIEVLRGPQGTLYGRNTSAGAINLITKSPDLDEFTGRALAEAGDYGLLRGKIGISGPIVSGVLGGSLAVAAKQRDGYEYNPFLRKDLSTEDNWSARGAIRWQPQAGTDIALSADYLDEDRVPGALDATPEDRMTSLDLDVFEKREVYGANLTVNHDLGDRLALTSITAFRDYTFDRLGDDDGTPVPAFASPVTESTAQFSQEIRLSSRSASRFDWVAGVYYLHTDLDGTSNPEIDPNGIFQLLTGGALDCPTMLGFQGTPAAIIPFLCAPGVGDNQINQKTETFAVFGQGTYNITDRLSATVGLRYSIDEKDFVNVQNSASVPLFLAFVPPGAVDVSRKDEEFLPKLSVEYAATGNLNLYASAARGFNAGGFNTAPVGPGGEIETSYEPETLTSYEVGAKWASSDNRYGLSGAVFFIDYEDFQAFRRIETSPAVFTPTIDNAEKASSRGVEVEAFAQLTDYLSYSGSAGYTDAKYDTYTNCGVSVSLPPLPLDCNGKQIANSPDWTATSALRLAYPISGTTGLKALASAEWSYRGDVFYSVENEAASLQEGFSLFNASVGLAKDDHWTLTLWGQNLSDEEYSVIAIDGFTTKIREFGPPRTWGVRLDLTF